MTKHAQFYDFLMQKLHKTSKAEIRNEIHDIIIMFCKLLDVAEELQKLFLHEMATIKIDTEYRVGYVDGLQCALNKLKELSK